MAREVFLRLMHEVVHVDFGWGMVGGHAEDEGVPVGGRCSDSAWPQLEGHIGREGFGLGSVGVLGGGCYEHLAELFVFFLEAGVLLYWDDGG